MGLFSLEHSKTVYWADFVLHGGAAVALLGVLVVSTPHHAAGTLGAPALGLGTGLALGLGLGLVVTGVALWTLLEYLLHRFVLHGLRPFRQWHARHHARPQALICGPTLLSAALLAGGVFAPLRWWLPLHLATALTLGVLLGYLTYGLTHHATHHWRAGSAAMGRRKHWHALHHHSLQPGCYGVTTRVWDRVFRTTLAGPGLRLAPHPG